jgi:hypothetical protein
MKRRFLLCLLCVSILLSFVSCAIERHDLLYTVTVGNRTFAVRGTEERAKQIVVKENDTIIQCTRVKIDKKIGTRNGNYGFVATDLNFDGLTDFMIADDVSGECVSYLCYLATDGGSKFVYSESLSNLYNIQVNTEQQTLFAFSHNKKS